MLKMTLTPKLRVIFRSIVLLYLLAFLGKAVLAQSQATDSLFRLLKLQDSLLFNIGYNQCDLKQFETLVSEDFEFYHDKSGPTLSKATFLAGVKEGLCKLNYRAQRVLVEGSLQVFPMEQNGILYAAIQMGRHEFYAIEKDKAPYLTSTALFTHFWLLEQGQWRLSKVLSYDHQVPSTPALKKK